ncbi:MAG TPA: glutamate 5-kinase [Solirubrobacteraceae bacterium]|nr:glutamate 5-kinase [Solirubrobacteraceae bacterium]
MARFVIKLGSSIVAEDDGELRAAVIAGVCAEAARRHAAGDDVVLVTSGAIARGMRVMHLAVRPRAIEDLQAASAIGQGKLYRVYDELLREHAVTSAQVLLTFFDMSARTHYLNARQTLGKLLEWRVLPVINENDTTATDEISFGDNDFLAAQVAMLVGADLLVLLTDVEGLYTASPRIDPTAELVPLVDDFDALGALRIGHTTSPLGSGGMRSKVVAAEMATAGGIETVICSGLRDGALAAALDGEPAGTRFVAREARYSSFKLWLKYAKPAHGTVVVDAGAARALREGGTSLLPVGITDVRGAFDAGDAVQVAHGAIVIGKGICNYAADELVKVKGMKSAAVREVLPRATDEAIHRDYFVLS